MVHVFAQGNYPITVIVVLRRDGNASFLTECIFLRTYLNNLFSFLFLVMNYDQNDNQITAPGSQVRKQNEWNPVNPRNLNFYQQSMHQTHQDSHHFQNAPLLNEEADSSSSISANFGASQKQIFLPISSTIEFINELSPKLDYDILPVVEPSNNFDNGRSAFSDIEKRQNSQMKKIYYPNGGRVQTKTVVFEPSMQESRGVISVVEPPELDSARIRNWKPLF